MPAVKGRNKWEEIKMKYVNAAVFRTLPIRKLSIFFLLFIGILVIVIASGSVIPASVTADDEVAAFDEEEEAAFDSEPAATVQEGGGTALQLMHADHYHPAGYFPDRMKRSADAYPWMHIVPFAMLVILAVLTTQLLGKRRRKPVLAKSRVRLEKAASIGIGILIATSATVGISNALTYSSVKDAVVSFMGEGKKIYQTSIDITPDIKQMFAKELKWEPQESSIKVYYSKNADDVAEDYAFVLSDRLPQCGGLHKYCIKVSSKGQVEGVKILELTCDRSYCINTKSFLNQFKSFNSTNAKQEKYDAISGATYSTNLTYNIVRRTLMLYNILKGNTHA
jgi:hypothetical protein